MYRTMGHNKGKLKFGKILLQLCRYIHYTAATKGTMEEWRGFIPAAAD